METDETSLEVRETPWDTHLFTCPALEYMLACPAWSSELHCDILCVTLALCLCAVEGLLHSCLSTVCVSCLYAQVCRYVLLHSLVEGGGGLLGNEVMNVHRVSCF